VSTQPAVESGQRWDPQRYARNARYVSDLGAGVLDLLAPQPGERILDLGCGDGALTKTLRDLGGRVTGVDSSEEQIAAAAALGLDVKVADAQRLAFTDEFDAVFSNAALHWMKDPDAVIAGVWRALRPGGRFVAEMGGAGNIAEIRRALTASFARRGLDAGRLSPWYFPSAEEYGDKLRAAGFRVRTIELFARPTPLPTSLADWLDTFAEPFLLTLAPAAREEVKAEIERSAAGALRQADGRWQADYVRLRFAADKPSGAHSSQSGPSPGAERRER
jgi:trans-aconitate methyltransferase